MFDIEKETDIYYNENELAGVPIEGFSGETCYDCHRCSNQLFWFGGGYWCQFCGAYNRFSKMMKPLFKRPHHGASVLDLLIGYYIPRLDVEDA